MAGSKAAVLTTAGVIIAAAVTVTVPATIQVARQNGQLSSQVANLKLELGFAQGRLVTLRAEIHTLRHLGKIGAKEAAQLRSSVRALADEIRALAAKLRMLGVSPLEIVRIITQTSKHPPPSHPSPRPSPSTHPSPPCPIPVPPPLPCP